MSPFSPLLQMVTLLSIVMKHAIPCPATSTTTAPVVTITTTITTTTPTTTTTTTTATTTSPCQSCSLNSITLTPGNGQGTATPVPSLSQDASSCLLLTVTCTAPPGQQTFMQFNVNQGGPLQPIGAVVTAMLNCVNGQWVFAPAGLPSRVITEVNCVNTVG